MERLPWNPGELIKSCESASGALEEEALERHVRSHQTWLEAHAPTSFTAPRHAHLHVEPISQHVSPHVTRPARPTRISMSVPGDLSTHIALARATSTQLQLQGSIQPCASIGETTGGEASVPVGEELSELSVQQLQSQLSVEQEQLLVQAAAQGFKKPGEEPLSEEEELKLSSSEGDEEESEFQAALAQIPSWSSQLTGRGLVVGLLLGAVFCVVTHRLNLGPGFIPSLNIAAGLLAFFLLKAWTVAAKQLGFSTGSFGAQECNVVQTFITACSSVAFTGGFAHYLTALDHKSYELLGGEDAPGNRIQDVYEPTLRRVIPYLLSTSMIGVFMLVALRKTMIIDYNLTFPSGTATGLMVDSFFTKSGAKMVGGQLMQMGRFFCVSFLWDAFQWLFSSTSCSFCMDAYCGLDSLPIFGQLAKQWSFYFSPSPNIIGAGMICPHEVNLSMLFGALMTSACLWPYIASKEGDWYAAGQDEHAFGGLFGYKVFLTIAMLMGDGVYNVVKVLSASAHAYFSLVMAERCKKRCAMQGCSILGGAVGACSMESPKARALKCCRAKCAAQNSGAGRFPCVPATASTSSSTANGSNEHVTPGAAAWFPADTPTTTIAEADGDHADAELRQPLLLERESAAQTEAVATTTAGGTTPFAASVSSGTPKYYAHPDLMDASLASKESPLERRLRRHVFLTDTIPAWVSAAGYLCFMVLGCIIIPRIYPAVKWYYVLMGFLAGPIMSLPVVFGQGLTDWDVSSMVCKLAIFAFAAWAGLENGGVVAGLAMAGVILGATSTSATLMQDFRTGYIVKCAPRAMFVAQLAGAAAGVVIAPLTFALFWATGKVGVPGGPYPTPYSAIYRAMAIFGTQGMTMLPKHCALMMAVFFGAAIFINLARDVLPQRYARWLPIPMAMSIPFVLGAYIAIDMTLGSLILALWEWRDPQAAELLAPAVASGLIVGDGVFSVPLSVMGMLNIDAPFCIALGGNGPAPA